MQITITLAQCLCIFVWTTEKVVHGADEFADDFDDAFEDLDYSVSNFRFGPRWIPCKSHDDCTVIREYYKCLPNHDDLLFNDHLMGRPSPDDLPFLCSSLLDYEAERQKFHLSQDDYLKYVVMPCETDGECMKRDGPDYSCVPAFEYFTHWSNDTTFGRIFPTWVCGKDWD